MERLQLQKNLGWHFYFCSLSFLILEFGFWCSLCWGGLGFLGQSVYRAAETARWGQSRFHCWSGVSFLRGFREASQWSHSSVVRLLYLWVSLFWYEFFLKFTRVFFLFFFPVFPCLFTVINLMWTFKRLTAMFTSLKEAVQGIGMKFIKKASPSSTWFSLYACVGS